MPFSKPSWTEKFLMKKRLCLNTCELFRRISAERNRFVTESSKLANCYKNLRISFIFSLPFHFPYDRIAELALVCRRAAASVEKRVFRREIKPRLFRRWQTAPSIAARQCCRAPAFTGRRRRDSFRTAWLGCLAPGGTLFPG